jgi:hypothetical protein
MYSFAVNGDRALIQRLCNEWFQAPSGGEVEYTVLTQRLFVTSVSVASVSPGDPKYGALGTMPEIDLGIWALVIRTKPAEMWPRWLPLQLFVDSGGAAFVGREVYGFPKQLGRLRAPKTAPSSEPFVVKTQVPTEKPAPNPTWREVIHVRPIASQQEASATSWASLEEAHNSLIQLAATIDRGLIGTVFPTLGDFQDSLVPGLMRMVFLKQFLEVTGASRACYQAIVEGSTRVVSFRSGGFTAQQYEINVQSCGSQPFESVLGLKPGWQKIGHGIWLNFDFAMQDGETLWRAP